MIINFHPKEIESKKGVELINKLNEDGRHTVVHASDKTPEEWRAIVGGSEELVLAGPVYWWGGSHVFDQWAQDVLTYGFAYKYNEQGMPEGLLNGRAFSYHLTHGTPAAYAAVMRENIKTRLEQGVFGFCGAKVAVHFYDPSEVGA